MGDETRIQVYLQMHVQMDRDVNINRDICIVKKIHDLLFASQMPKKSMV